MRVQGNHRVVVRKLSVHRLWHGYLARQALLSLIDGYANLCFP